MGNSTSTIELNGKRYDARTGKVIGEASAAAPPNPPVKRSETGQVLDGFVRRPQPSTQSSTTSGNSIPQKPKVAKTTSKHLKRKTEKSHTLMRPSVKKPTIKNDIQPVKTTPRVNVENTARISRAQKTEKSPHISKFGGRSTSVIKKEATLPVVTPTLTAAISKNVHNELHKLENALIDANAHLHQLEKKAVKKPPLLSRIGFKNRFANVAALSAAFLLLIGFFAYQNTALITMKVAAARSGVNANLPSYSPAGYAVNRAVESEPGRVTVTYQSRTDDKNFRVIQEESSWNSASLLANHVSKERCDTCFQTWQNEGKTVYIYDNSNATWVNGGVWYRVEGNASLTSDQLLRLANSF